MLCELIGTMRRVELDYACICARQESIRRAHGVDARVPGNACSPGSGNVYGMVQYGTHVALSRACVAVVRREPEEHAVCCTAVRRSRINTSNLLDDSFNSRKLNLKRQKIERERARDERNEPRRNHGSGQLR